MYDTEEVQSHCPYCGEAISLLIDLSAGSQHYIEDCQVCCRPIEVTLHKTADDFPQVELRTDSD